MMEELELLLARSRLYRNQVDHPDFVKLRQTLATLLKNKDCVKTLFGALAYVRDIAGGRGERVLTYMMLDVWYQYFPVLAGNALESLTLLGYGSWRDIKGLCVYLHSIRPDHPLILTAVEIMVKNLETPGVAKWAPRETSKKWLYELCVLEKYGVCTTEKKRQFRLHVSALSRRCGTNMYMRLEPRFDPGDSLNKWTGTDQEWKAWCQKKRAGFDPGVVVPVLVLTPEQRDVMREAVLEVLWMVEVSNIRRILVATVPPQEVWIDRDDGFAHNVQMLLNLLERHSLRHMEIQSTIAVSPGRLPVCLSTVLAHARYAPMLQRFDDCFPD